MQYLYGFLVILSFTFLGETFSALIPLPIPASVYGLLLLFSALCLKLVKLEQVKDISSFLVSIMPVLFVAPAVGIVEDWHMVADWLLPILLLMVGTTILTFGISGRIAQALMRKGGDKA